jgi:hypothetical protein
MTIRFNSYLTAGSLVLGIVGCGQPADAPAPVVEAPTATAAVASAAPVESVDSLTEAVAKTQADGEAEAGAPPTVEEDAKGAQAEYQPPFPDRIDLFVPPKRQDGMVFKEGGSEDAVELLGFVRLDKPQVVLSINGQVTPIFEGGSQYGIEVISIQPPKVVLQRGRQRWQASLEN